MYTMSEQVRKEYDRWLKKVGDDNPYEGNGIINLKEVLLAHFLIVDYFYKEGEGIGGIGPKNLGLLHSALSRQVAGYGSYTKWSKGLDVCATLFYGLIKNHPFHDANKRTAFLVALYHLEKINRTPSLPQKEFERFTIKVADDSFAMKEKRSKRIRKGTDEEISEIAHFFRKNSRRQDKRFYAVTYQQLNTILHRHGYSLENPVNNHIDIVRIEKKSRLFRGQFEKKTKVGQIGFPCWTKIVGKGAINTVRRVTGLTPNKGYDSQSFYYEVDPLPALISTYEKPLRRLADK